MIMFFTILVSVFILGLIVGIILVPSIIFLRARRVGGWDNSNMTNILRVFAHLATHPDDFIIMQYPNGKKPFWYLDKDEFSDVVKTRP